MKSRELERTNRARLVGKPGRDGGRCVKEHRAGFNGSKSYRGIIRFIMPRDRGSLFLSLFESESRLSLNPRGAQLPRP